MTLSTNIHIEKMIHELIEKMTILNRDNHYLLIKVAQNAENVKEIEGALRVLGVDKPDSWTPSHDTRDFILDDDDE